MLFITFAITFCISRIVAYPLLILRNVGWTSTDITIRYLGAQYFYMVLLGALQVLHLFWFKTIAYMVGQALFVDRFD